MKKINTTLSIIATILGSTTIIFLGLFISYLITANNYKIQLENAYKKNFYEVVANINDLEVDVSKIVATTDVSTQKELLTGIYNTSLLGVNNINLLPVNYNKLSKINNFLNRFGGFSYSLLLSLDNGNGISDEDYQQLTDLHNSIRDIQYDLNEYIANMNYDYNILDDIDFKDYDSEDFSAGVINTESSNSKIPTLIYDGPFSDSVLNKEIVGLDNVEYSRESIEEELVGIFNDEVTYVGESNGKFATYNFEVGSSSGSRYVSVTKRGGFLLTITSYSSISNDSEDLVDGVQVAQDFASDLGLKNMYSVWTQKTGNVMYVNLAPIINHIIHYSDLIKVKVDLGSGEVLGWEATNYATNHQPRSFESQISLATAQNKINNILEIKERNYCIVPDKFVGERSAYEFICTWQNYTYYIYIDSITGEEINILRVISTSNGDLLI